MKKVQVWFDQKWNHEYVMYEPIRWGMTACAATGAVICTIFLCRIWQDAFKTGQASPGQVVIAGFATLLLGGFGLFFAYMSSRYSYKYWTLNIRGFILWIITAPSGRQWKVVTPRGHVPRIESLVRRCVNNEWIGGVLYVGVPLGGWWHKGQIWFDDIRLPYAVMRPLKYVTNPVIISSRANPDRLLVSWNGPVLKLLRSFPKDTWTSCLAFTSGALDDLHLKKAVLTRRVAELEEQLNDWRAEANQMTIRYGNRQQECTALRVLCHKHEQKLAEVSSAIRDTKRFEVLSKDAKKIRMGIDEYLRHGKE